MALREIRSTRYRDRQHAGARLGEALSRLRGRDVLVLGIPRGGVPVAAEVARALAAELDIAVARKIGAPEQPELALGAVTAGGTLWLNRELLAEVGVSELWLGEQIAARRAEAQARERDLRGGRAPKPIAGRVAVLVDDGLATGATMRACVEAVRAARPARLVVAVPVGSVPACEELEGRVDQLVCPLRPEPFLAVGLHYDEFGQTSDAEVRALLDAAEG